MKLNIYRGARGPERMRKALVRSMMFVRRHGGGLRIAKAEEIIRFRHILAIGPMGCRFFSGRRWFCAEHIHPADVSCEFDDRTPEELKSMTCCKSSVFQKYAHPNAEE